MSLYKSVKFSFDGGKLINQDALVDTDSAELLKVVRISLFNLHGLCLDLLNIGEGFDQGHFIVAQITHTAVESCLISFYLV